MSENALPPRPTCVADLETLVHARGHHRQTAHIPDPDSAGPVPFCGRPNRHHGATWEEKPPSAFSSDPDAWLSLCQHCLAAVAEETDNE